MRQVIVPKVSEQVLATTLELISDGIWDWNALTGYVYRSPGWYRMLGYEVDSLDNTVFTWENIIHKDDYDRVMKHFDDYISGRVPHYKIQYRCVMKSGDYLWIEDRGSIVEWTEQGTVARMIGAHRDINAEKLLLQQSQKNTQSLQEVVELRTKELNDLNHQLQNKIAETERLATTDFLTSLSNRYFFEQKLEREIARAVRFNEPLSLLIMDLDYFKEINDQHGHATGDHVLVLVSQLLMDNIREIDIAARWGGDEFMLVLPNTSLQHAESLAEKLRGLINNLDFDIDIAVSVSIGVTQYKTGEEPIRFISRSDTALYEAKQAGRDRLVSRV